MRFAGVETQMPLMLTAIAGGRRGSICDYVRWSAANPAKLWDCTRARHHPIGRGR